MFLSALQTYAVIIIIAVIILQYAFALFCLLKLAYFDVPKTHYILWNLFILIVFFIGGTAFLIYYYYHPEKHIAPASSDAPPEQNEQAEQSEQTERDEQPETNVSEQTERIDDEQDAE